MNQSLHHAYLRAMGIDLWVERKAVAVAAPCVNPAAVLQPQATSSRAVVATGIVVGPGSGNTLLLCAHSEEAATTLAADIARCLDSVPVWSWPAGGDSEAGVPLEQAIEEHLFTRVLVFGPSELLPADSAGDGVVGSALVLRADSIPELLKSGSARRRLWAGLEANHWCVRNVIQG